MPDAPSPKRILVADDDPSILRLVAAVLRRQKYDVDCAADGREALTKIESHTYDVIVLDLMMPEVSGFEVLKQLEASDPAGRRVVIMSAASHAMIQQAMSPNVFATLLKPFDLESMLEAVRGCIEAA